MAVACFFGHKKWKKLMAARRAEAEEARKAKEAAKAKAEAEAAAKAAEEAAAKKAAEEAEERKARAAAEAVRAKALAEEARIQAEKDAKERAIREAQEKERAAAEKKRKDAEMTVWMFHLGEAGAMADEAKAKRKEEERKEAERQAVQSQIEEMRQAFWSGSPAPEEQSKLVKSETRNGVLDHKKDLEFLWAGMGMLSHRGVSTTRGIEPHQMIAPRSSPESRKSQAVSAGSSPAKEEPLTVTRELTFDEQEDDNEGAATLSA